MYKVLVAEDEPNILGLIKLILEQDYDVITAKDGATAYELFLKEKPDLIIIDLMMPNMNGFELCRKIKGSDVKKIILSAKAHEKDILKGIELGADLYLTKPFDPDQLLSKIHGVLG